ncbi:MAG: lipopolysaccharide cholinephosphotransferase [Clostridiales bacterium]|nr:LicD family protein [uncultured Clostridium sp.]MDK2807494.1 lipopolysaccharide cholinephosphotransferase [Clostridiales bacterium]
MIALSDEKLRTLQLTELELLEEVDRICKKQNIHYNIIAGTLLGAVRHRGFIPWDDDADVALLRAEYERFVEACRIELDTTRFYFQDHNETNGYRWGYGKLRRKETLFLREYQEHMPYEQGVFIDVFPLDYVPNCHLGRAFSNFMCFVYRKFFWSEVGKIADKNVLKRVIYKIMSRYPEKKLKDSFNRYIKKRDRKVTDWVRILTFPTPNKEYGYKTKWYEKSANIYFEGILFHGIEEYDEYLSFKFGDYMSLPPEKDRKIHPVSKIKLLK